MAVVQAINTDGKKGLVQVNILEYRDTALTIPFNFNKDTTGLLYRFTVVDANGTEIFDKDLDVIDLVAGEWQLTITKNNSINEWEDLPFSEYRYIITECVVATGGDAQVLLAGNFCVLNPGADC